MTSCPRATTRRPAICGVPVTNRVRLRVRIDHRLIAIDCKVPWQTALGMVFWARVLFLIVSATPLREHIALAIPRLGKNKT